MGRRDHSFLFRDSSGREGIAFCRAGDFGRGEASSEVKRVLAQAAGGWEQVAYLGPLSYEEMDDGAGDLLTAFAKHDPVWFAYLSPGGDT